MIQNNLTQYVPGGGQLGCNSLKMSRAILPCSHPPDGGPTTHPHLKIDDEPVEELKKTRDGMAIIRFIILLLLILYDPGLACHSDNFMSLV